MTMTHVSRFVRELANRLDGATRRAVRGADLGGSGELLQATQALLDDLLPVAQRQKLAPRPAMLDGLVNAVGPAFGSRLPRSGAVETVPSTGLSPVFVDSEQTATASRSTRGCQTAKISGSGD